MVFSMKTLELNLSNIGTRNEVRKKVIYVFLNESPGTGRGELATRYNYIVAKLKKRNKVILARPANKRFGFDFLIRVENTNFNISGKRSSNPKHEDILNDLQKKANCNNSKYNNLLEYICDIYNCSIDVESADLEKLNFDRGFDPDLILHVLKWFFIEQDIRYWNYSGRKMLMDKILSIK